MRRSMVSVWLAMVLVLPDAALACGCGRDAVAESTSAKVYRAVGVIKSFGPQRAFVNIAHENIPGYMAAMTMSFEPSDTAQLRALSVGDRVRFEFVETADARRVLKAIKVQR